MLPPFFRQASPGAANGHEYEVARGESQRAPHLTQRLIFLVGQRTADRMRTPGMPLTHGAPPCLCTSRQPCGGCTRCVPLCDSPASPPDEWDTSLFLVAALSAPPGSASTRPPIAPGVPLRHDRARSTDSHGPQ